MATVHQSKNRSDLDSNELLLERLDKMTTIMAASAQGHYRRTYQAFDIASPGPLAFFSFAIATGMQGLVYTGTLEVQGSQLVLIVGLFIGGFLMFICGFMEFLRRNTFGATMFTLFGAFWFTLTIYNLLLFAGVATFMLTAMPKTVACLAGTLGFITAVMAIVVANLTLAVATAQGLLALFLILLAAAQMNPANHTLLKVGGAFGIITAIAAFYVAMALSCEEVLGQEILPMLYSKKFKMHAGNLYPRISLSDPLALSAGVPYEGRYEIHKGDNVAAMQQPSLVDLNRIQADQRV
uniref:Uncharacterized protein n=1 Tax=Auxenochlorella protothecoides TaxID=3075 RepID=A0A1D1ZZC8_AUXPR